MKEQEHRALVEQHRSAAGDIIELLVLNNLTVVLQVVLNDPAKLKKFRKGLIKARDILNQALPE